MDYQIAMGFISWMLMIIMITGFALVKMFENELKNLNKDEIERLKSEAFLMPYHSSGFVGKVNFILLHGARFWGIVLGDKFKNTKKGD